MFDNDGHFIDDPLAIVNAKPDFEGIGEFIPYTKNCIIINGKVYALEDVSEEENEAHPWDFCEKLCDLYQTCRIDLNCVSHTLCDIHNATRLQVYKKKEYGKD